MSRGYIWRLAHQHLLYPYVCVSMKTRIIQNSLWEYMVQKKYRYRPFWIDDTYWYMWLATIEMWTDKLNDAKEKEKIIIKRYKQKYNKIHKIIS